MKITNIIGMLTDVQIPFYNVGTRQYFHKKNISNKLGYNASYCVFIYLL